MERNRIIIETGDNKPQEAQLQSIENKITEIQKKMSPPWVMPVLVVVITAIMTCVNYLTQRHYVNADIYSNKLKEKIADLRATATVDFYRRSLEALDTIDVSFASYCLIDTSSDEDILITRSLVSLNSLMNHQMVVDTSVRKKIKAYTEYVSEQGVDLQTYPGKEKLKEIYAESAIRYAAARNEIDKSLLTLTR